MYKQKLEDLENAMLAMAAMVEEAITASVDALRRRDLAASRRIVESDLLINQRRFEIEAECLITIATQQPMAGDLRVIAAMLYIITELERMGDYAKGIARINEMIGPGPLIKPLIDIPRLADHVCSMLRQTLNAFSQRDVDASRAIPEQDDIADALYNQIYRELMTYVISDPRTIEQVNYLLWVAHNLERTADRVINICERTVFTVTGQMEELDSDDQGPHGLA
jgi:phosphate transport system protein